MRAAVYEKTGAARDVLSIADLPTPTPNAGEVRVKLACSGVNPSDVKSRAGLRSKTLPFPKIIPHSDGAGVIDDVGADVSRDRIGERVWIWNGAWKRPFGTAAEYVVLPSHQAVALPKNIDLAVGACLGIPALTAYHAVTVDGGVAGKSVLVAGGAGAVGHYAIQIARLKGAKQIITTVSNEQKAALAHAAGANVIVNYKTEDMNARIQEATNGQGVDRIIEVEFAGNIGIDLQAIKPEGDIIVYGSNAAEIAVPFFPTILKSVRMRFFIVYHLNSDDRKRAITDLTAMLEQSSLIHNIATRLPLERIAEAHEMIEQNRAIGNVILSIE